MTELLPGVYRYEDRDSYTNRGEILLAVQDRGTVLRMQLVSNTMRFSPAHIDMLFKNKKSVTVKKANGPHAINFVGNDWFCIYPYRAGIPFAFEKMEGST